MPRRTDALRQRYEELERQGNYSTAVLVAKRACSILRRTSDLEPAPFVSCLSDLARLHRQAGNYRLADSTLDQAMRIGKKVLERGHPSVLDALGELALLRLDQRDFDAAERILRDLVPTVKKVKGPNHPNVAVYLNNLARALASSGQYDEVEALYERAIEINETAFGKTDPRVATDLNNLASFYRIRGDCKKAEETFARALQINESTLGPNHPEVATNLNNVGLLHAECGDLGRAESVLHRALAIRKEALGPNHPLVATTLVNLEFVQSKQGRHEQSEALLKQALTIYDDALGPESLDSTYLRNNLASLYFLQGRYREAQAMYLRSQTLLEKLLGPDHPTVATSMNNLAALNMELGYYEAALLLARRALEIAEAAQGASHPHVAQSRNNLAVIHEKMGDYRESELLKRQALRVSEETLGPRHPQVATCLNNLAWLFRQQGEYEKAERAQRRAIDIWRDALGHKHSEVAVGVENLAFIYYDQGEYVRAESLFREALAIREETPGINPSGAANCLYNIATIRMKMEDFTEAEALFFRALAIRKQTLGPDHFEVAKSFVGIGLLHEQRGNPEEAERSYLEALTRMERLLGRDHLEVAKVLENLGRIQFTLGRHDSAAATYGQAYEAQYKDMLGTLLFAEEHRRLEYSKTTARKLDRALSLHLLGAPEHQPLAELALTTLLRHKGLVLELGTKVADVVRRSLPEEHRYLIEEIVASRARLAYIAKRGPRSSTTDDFASEVAAVHDDQDRLWNEILEHSSTTESFQSLTLSHIQRTLPVDGVLIEMVRYVPSLPRSSHAGTESRYAAYLVFPSGFDWVDLGPAEVIDAHVEVFRRAITLKLPITSALYRAVMEPLVERLHGARRLFIAPDSTLNLVPFAAFYDGERYLVERYVLHNLSAGRELLSLDDSSFVDNDEMVIVANPTGSDLSGAEHEAKMLRQLFPDSTVMLGDEATEVEVRRRERPWIMHLGMHGFFDVSSEGDGLDNPMVRTGLLLARDQDERRGTPSADGRLTAYEISGLDLRGTELVVLSACDTGLGETQAGQGVFGLRRAFAIAGTQTQVVSLWKVNDTATAALMVAYYRRLLVGKGRSEAMQEVQLEMLRNAEHRHPRDWAGFMVVGDWRPLSADHFPEMEAHAPIGTPVRGCHRASITGSSSHFPLVLLVLMGAMIRRRRRCRRTHPR